MISTKEEHIKFLNEQVVNPLSKIKSENSIIFAFILMAQSLEIIGAYLDNKPMRAKNQSSKRFNLAVNKLFKKEYRDLNSNNFLYKQLRTCLLHMFIPSSKTELRFGKAPSGIHPVASENKVVFYADDFYEDIERAVNQIIRMIDNGKIKPKKISCGEFDGL